MSSKFTNKKSNEYIFTRDNWASYWHYTKVGLFSFYSTSPRLKYQNGFFKILISFFKNYKKKNANLIVYK